MHLIPTPSGILVTAYGPDYPYPEWTLWSEAQKANAYAYGYRVGSGQHGDILLPLSARDPYYQQGWCEGNAERPCTSSPP